MSAPLLDVRSIQRVAKQQSLWRPHIIDHCLNHIRQAIQCHGDMTPVTSIYMPSVNTMVGNFEQAHTCRDWSKVKAWLAERAAQDEIRGLVGPSPTTAIITRIQPRR